MSPMESPSILIMDVNGTLKTFAAPIALASVRFAALLVVLLLRITTFHATKLSAPRLGRFLGRYSVTSINGYLMGRRNLHSWNALSVIFSSAQIAVVSVQMNIVAIVHAR